MRGILVSFLATVAVISAAERAAAVDDPSTKTTGSVRIRVVDEAGQPVANAHVHGSVWTNDKAFKSNRNYTTDSHGLATVELPATLQIVRVWASAKGYAPMFAQLWPQAPVEAHPLPHEFTYTLKPGTSMGGVIHDDQDRPIQGARVEVRYDSGGIGDKEHPPAQYDTWLAEGDTAVVTDAEGRWSLDNVPPGDDVKVRVKLSHPDFVNDTRWGELQKEQRVTATRLRDQSAVIVMHRGIRVTGRVTDPGGKPVKDAVVIHGDQPYWQDGSQEVRTGADGVYRFDPLKTGPMRITLAARGWMPQSRKIEIAPNLEPFDFQLQPGRKLRIKFVDASGTPVPDVYVTLRRWRGVEALYNVKHPNVVDLAIPTKSDKHGIFEWTWAPDDAVDYAYQTVDSAESEATITADGREHVLSIVRPLRFTGTVTDAATGQPIDRFRVVPVIYFNPEFAMLPRQDARDFEAGTFAIDLDRTDVTHGVQIEAPGYVTFRTDHRYTVGEESPTLDVKLQPAEPARGMVVDAADRPVAGATIYVATGFQHLDLTDFADPRGDSSSNYAVEADELGRFEIVPQMEPYTLVVVAPQGYAEAERSPGDLPGQLRVQRWARIKGRLVQDGKPMAGDIVYVEPLRVGGRGEPRIELTCRAETGEDGTFAVERAAPLACHVWPYLHWAVESPLKSSRSMPLDLKPGEEVTLELGSGGAELTGRLVLDPPRDKFDYHFSISYLVAQRPGIQPPDFLAAKSPGWQTAWSDAWRNSLEGRAHLNTLHHWFVKPDADGQFRISGVEPGDYQLVIALYGTTEGCLVHPVAQRVVPITVGAGQPAIDLETITVPTQGVPQVGDLAANFEFTAPDGKPTDLAAQRGKYVLVDFWATWCGPCVAKLGEVEAVQKEFAADGRLIVVGANLDAEQGRVEAFLQKRPLAWHHAFLGDWSATGVPKCYGVTSVPAYVLIDPEGKIAAIEYALDTLAPKLRKALAD